MGGGSTQRPEVFNVNFNIESDEVFRPCCTFCCFLLFLFVCFAFKFKSEKSVRRQEELCSTGKLESIQMQEPPSQLRKMSERVPKSHHSLPGHFPTFGEIQYIRGPQNTFKPTHFQPASELQKNKREKQKDLKPQRTAFLYYSPFRIRKVTLFYNTIPPEM